MNTICPWTKGVSSPTGKACSYTRPSHMVGARVRSKGGSVFFPLVIIIEFISGT